MNNNQHKINKDYLIGGILFGLVSIPIYFYLGNVKFILYPLVAWMVWTKRTEFFPGLIIHLFTESSVTYVILFTTFLLFIYHYRFWIQISMKKLFWITLIPLPFVVWQFYQKYFVNSELMIESISPLQYYLSLFPFFYGLLLNKSGRKINYDYLLFVFFFAIILQLSGQLTNTVRIIMLASPIVINFSLFIPLKRGIFSVFIKTLGILLFLSVIFSLKERSLTSTGILIFSIVFYYLRTKSEWFKRIALSSFLIGSSIVFVAVIIYINFDAPKMGYLKIDSSINKEMTIIERIQSKSLEDRAPIWVSTFQDLIQENQWFPKKTSDLILIYGIDGSVYESEIEAHNLFLALLRNYGYLIGVIVSVIYIYFLVRIIQCFRNCNLEKLEMIIVSSLVSIALVGTTTAQFPLMSPFSFAYIGLIGYFSGKLFKNKANND